MARRDGVKGTRDSIEKGFTAGQAVRLTGVAYATLNVWAKTGFLVPSVAGADGSGSMRRYSFGDLVALKIAHSLRGGNLQVELAAIRPLVKTIQADETLTASMEPMPWRMLATDGDRVRFYASEAEWLKGNDEPPSDLAPCPMGFFASDRAPVATTWLSFNYGAIVNAMLEAVKAG
jgi:DNA-binding transcriptional MerR regulator